MFKQTIRKKIFFYIFSLTTLSMIIISLAIYFLFFQTLQRNEIKYVVQASDKTKQTVEFVLRLVTNTGTSLGSNKELLDELNKDYILTSPSYQDSQNKISNMLQNIIGVQQYIKGIYILSPKGNFYTNNLGVNEEELKDLYRSYISDGDNAKEYFTGVHNVTYHPALTSSAISYIRPIFNIESGKIIGAVIIDIDYDLLREILTISSIQNDEKVLLIGTNKEIIFNYPYNVILDDVIQDNPILLESKKLQLSTKVFGNDSLIFSNTIDFSDWKIIKIISSNKIHQETTSLQTAAIYIFIIFIIISLIVSFFLSIALTNPITELNKKFKLVETGDLSVSIKVKSKDEMGQLGFSFNNMVKKLKMLINDQLEIQKKKSDMEFQILEAQINPHFLYNTLDSIKWLAVIQNVNNISDMTTALINLLKYNISKNTPTVSLAEEIESVVNYVKIQKYRYGDMFNIELNIDESTENCHILKLILQPIVENAIIHGFENTKGDGIIKIKSRIIENDLFLEISDNGTGMDNDTLHSINKNEDFKKKFSAIGVNNIQERIKVYFGENYGLSFSSNLNQGTVVTIKLPVSR